MLNMADSPSSDRLGAHPDRVYDRDIIGEFYRGVRPFTSPKLGLYWRGPLELSDGTKVQIVLLEGTDDRFAYLFCDVSRDA